MLDPAESGGMMQYGRLFRFAARLAPEGARYGRGERADKTLGSRLDGTQPAAPEVLPVILLCSLSTDYTLHRFPQISQLGFGTESFGGLRTASAPEPEIRTPEPESVQAYRIVVSAKMFLFRASVPSTSLRAGSEAVGVIVPRTKDEVLKDKAMGKEKGEMAKSGHSPFVISAFPFALVPCRGAF